MRSRFLVCVLLGPGGCELLNPGDSLTRVLMVFHRVFMVFHRVFMVFHRVLMVFHRDFVVFFVCELNWGDFWSF